MKPLIVDVETTIFQKGNPFADRNKLCYVGSRDYYYSGADRIRKLDGFGIPFGPGLELSKSDINGGDYFVGFNIKFDLHWLKRYGILQSCKHLWDCQLAEFIIQGQQHAMPSLDDTCHRVGIGGKSDDLAERYWNRGIDTPDIPESEVREYLAGDLLATEKLFQWQQKYLKDKPKLKRLIWNACQDLKLTQEMEWHGLNYNLSNSRKLGDTKLSRINDIDSTLDGIVGVSSGEVNWNSGDQLSAVLYGGTILVEGREQYLFRYKDGREKLKERKCQRPITFERLVEPLKNSEAAKAGIFLTNEGVLKKLRANGKAKQIIGLVLERAKIDTQVSRYLHGIPKLYEEMDWTNGIIHHQLNHCTAKTGRLASSKPNGQNLDEEALKCIETRFK